MVREEELNSDFGITVIAIITIVIFICFGIGLGFSKYLDHESYRACLETAKINKDVKCIPPGYDHFSIRK